ncbi:MAG: hypothetical protein JSS36_08250 [Proteobacteria bacterium]|nr:hypothetical protein [Pseudomonadota bacterium]
MALLGYDSGYAPAWEVLLAVKEHDGPATLDAVVSACAMPVDLARRWLRVLVADELVAGPAASDPPAIRLTAKADALLERIFSSPA